MQIDKLPCIKIIKYNTIPWCIPIGYLTIHCGISIYEMYGGGLWTKLTCRNVVSEYAICRMQTCNAVSEYAICRMQRCNAVSGDAICRMQRYNMPYPKAICRIR